MNKGEEKKIHEILESGSIGYAYLFDAKARKTLEKVVSLEPENLAGRGLVRSTPPLEFQTALPAAGKLEPENLAALFRKYGTEMEWMSVTDMRDRMVLRAASGKISSCKDEEMRREIEQHLTALLSAGEKATKVLEVDKKAADQYFGEEDQAVTWAEYGMEIWLR